MIGVSIVNSVTRRCFCVTGDVKDGPSTVTKDSGAVGTVSLTWVARILVSHLEYALPFPGLLHNGVKVHCNSQKYPQERRCPIAG